MKIDLLSSLCSRVERNVSYKKGIKVWKISYLKPDYLHAESLIGISGCKKQFTIFSECLKVIFDLKEV